MAQSTLDAERVPGWYSVTVAIGCGLWVTLMAVVTHGSAVTRGIVGVVFVFIAAGLFWVFRVSFRRVLAKPLPRRGLTRWLTVQPVWLMVLACLGYGLALPLGVVAVVSSVESVPVAGFVLGAGPVCVLAGWAQAAGWLELQRQGARS